MRQWQLQEAKARLSELIRTTLEQGPQEITVRGSAAVVVVSTEEFERLRRPRESFVQFIRRSPLYGVELNLERDASPTRDIEL